MVEPVSSNQKLRALVDRAVEVLQRHIPPDGLPDHDALLELYGIFDGPDYRVAIAAYDAERATVEPRACCFDAPEGMHHPTCLNIGSPVTRAAEPPDVLRDAERYRYIRSDACGLTLTEDLLFGDRLDMAIDTEMSRAVLTKGEAL